MIAVISDIHGNYPALKAVLDEVENQKIEQIYCLGDIAGYYCYINECIDLCREKKVFNILGNHDEYLLSGRGCPRSYSANICLNYQKETITKENKAWLMNSLPLYDDSFFSFRHGGWEDPLDEYIYNFSFDLVRGYKQRIFASGHTHIQSLIKEDNKLYFNPGSVGQPRDYNSKAAYALITDDGSVILRRCEYPIDETVEKMKQLGFPNRISNCLYWGCKIGEKV